MVALYQAPFSHFQLEIFAVEISVGSVFLFELMSHRICEMPTLIVAEELLRGLEHLF